MPLPMAPVPPATEMTLDQVAPPVTLAPAPPGQGVIQRINVEGTQRIEPDSVLSYLLLRQGQLYDPASADRSLKTLFDTGLFADVRLDWDGMVLTVRVVENPILNQVVYEGNSTLSNMDLNMEVQVRPRMVFTRARVQADVQRIIELYRRSGHFAATVEPKIIQRPQNRVDLVFEINEGPTTGRGRDQLHRQPRVLRCRSTRADRHDDKRVVEIPHHQRQLRSRSVDVRPRAASPVLSRTRLRRFPRGIRRRRAHARPAGFLHHVHGRRG
jgi:hypothetical protein